MSSRRAFIKDKNDVAKRFMRAIFDANEAYAKSPEAMAPLVAEWSGQDEKIVAAAQQRMNPTTGLTEAQAQKWWEFIGTGDGRARRAEPQAQALPRHLRPQPAAVMTGPGYQQAWMRAR